MGCASGFWRLKAVLDRHRIKATVSLNGAVCKSYPRIVEACVKSGWEFMGHSYIQRPTHNEEDQQGMIRKTVATIKAATGKGAARVDGPRPDGDVGDAGPAGRRGNRVRL